MIEIIKDKLLMIFLILLIIGIIGGAVYFYFYLQKNAEEERVKAEQIAAQNVVEENTVIDNRIVNTDHASEYIDLSSWCGRYTNKDGKVFHIYQTGLKELESEIFPSSMEYDVNSDSLSGSYQGFNGDVGYSISLTRNGNQVTVNASTTDPQSNLNSFSGIFEKADFVGTWNGIYKSTTGTYVILSEPRKNVIRYTVLNNLSMNYGFVEKYTETEIKNEKTTNGNKETIMITKTENGINLRSASSETESILNSTSGEYTKLQ